jgi:hypothetical protein
MKRPAPRVSSLGVALAVVLVVHAHAAVASGEAYALVLRATTLATPGATLTINLVRWPTDAERAPLLAALTATPAAPVEPARGAGARSGRGAAAGRGARGGGAAIASPAARLTAAVKAAPTLGYVWGSGVTGYSIKYAWRSSASDWTGRLVLITDRRLDVSPAAAGASGVDAEGDFTVIEIRFDGRHTGEGKTSLTTNAVVDQPAGTVALQDYAAAPPLLRITP